MKSTGTTTRTPVWDLFVRFGHWILAAAFLIAYFTEDDLMTVHTWAGYLTASVVVLRILWGFVGSPHARFRDFLFTPRQAWHYLIDLLRGRADRHIGHSPAGAVMVYALLIGVLLTGVSGMMVYAYEEQAGPLAGAVASQYHGLTDRERERAFDRAEDFWEEAHELTANLTLLLVLLHIGGVLLASFAHRENLIASMVSGNKRPQDELRNT
ncbi:MAG: cytochrome b/b6 domain-containing protein [Pseudomonadales bacterium]